MRCCLLYTSRSRLFDKVLVTVLYEAESMKWLDMQACSPVKELNDIWTRSRLQCLLVQLSDLASQSLYNVDGKSNVMDLDSLRIQCNVMVYGNGGWTYLVETRGAESK